MEKYLYFFISYPKTIEENFDTFNFINPENKPVCIYSEEAGDNEKYYYNKIFKVKFQLSGDKFWISLSGKNLFIYDASFEAKKKNEELPTDIVQKTVEYSEKFEKFLKALESNKEREKIEDLYQDTIDLYSKQKDFVLLISLFIRIYQNKNLCLLLLENFRKNYSKPTNMDIKSYLKEYKSKFNYIMSEADQLINMNNYNIIDFYGIILCYFNIYDTDNFSIIVEKLSNIYPKELYEILLLYNAYLKNPIILQYNFFNKFIKYIFDHKKDFSDFLIGLNYIKDLFIFTNIIQDNKDYIIDLLINSTGNINDINNIINFLDCLEKYIINDKINSLMSEFLEKILKNNLFTIEDFFSNKKNNKFFLLYKLYETGKLNQIKNNEYYIDIENLLINIFNQIDRLEINKETLDEFMKNEKSEIIQRLSLIKFILLNFNPSDIYNKLKEINEKIDDDIRIKIYKR